MFTCNSILINEKPGRSDTVLHVHLNFSSGVYKKMRAEEARLGENNQDMEKVKQQHFIQEDKVKYVVFSVPDN